MTPVYYDAITAFEKTAVTRKKKHFYKINFNWVSSNPNGTKFHTPLLIHLDLQSVGEYHINGQRQHCPLMLLRIKSESPDSGNQYDTLTVMIGKGNVTKYGSVPKQAMLPSGNFTGWHRFNIII
jgi:hypothetical protein